jgi:hypothetical protein
MTGRHPMLAGDPGCDVDFSRLRATHRFPTTASVCGEWTGNRVDDRSSQHGPLAVRPSRDALARPGRSRTRGRPPSQCRGVRGGGPCSWRESGRQNRRQVLVHAATPAYGVPDVIVHSAGDTIANPVWQIRQRYSLRTGRSATVSTLVERQAGQQIGAVCESGGASGSPRVTSLPPNGSARTDATSQSSTVGGHSKKPVSGALLTKADVRPRCTWAVQRPPRTQYQRRRRPT